MPIIVECQQCGGEFNSKPSSRRKFCSRDCSDTALATTIKTIKCAMCDSEFDGVGRRSNNLYCSRACSDKRNKVASLEGTRRSEYKRVKCSSCGMKFDRRASEVRKVVFCSRECYGKGRTAGTTGSQGWKVFIGDEGYWANRTTKGYVTVYISGRGNIGMHRVVMEHELGRRLRRNEEVHHKNTIRDDNDPSNLELWSTSQPPGGRVEDKVEWAIELLKLYRPEVLVVQKPIKKLLKVGRCSSN